MKKYIVSILVVATFTVYSLYQRISSTSDFAVASTSSSNQITDTSTKTASTKVVVVKTPVSVSVKTVKPVPVPVKVVTNIGQYKDGQYKGVSADAYYGNIQVEATISGGKLTDVQFLDHPQDRGTSVRINTYAMPILRSEAIQAQSAQVNTVSGATDSSGAFRQSLGSALSQAINS